MELDNMSVNNVTYKYGQHEYVLFDFFAATIYIFSQ
jgi:hypothetical protein